MEVRWLSKRKGVKTAVQGRRPRRNLAGLFAFVTLGAGAFAGVAAIAGAGPFAGLQVLANHIVHPDAPKAPMEASTLFPPVQPVHKVVDVYDPPKYTSPTRPQPPEDAPASSPQPAQPTNPPDDSQSSPEPGDN